MDHNKIERKMSNDQKLVEELFGSDEEEDEVNEEAAVASASDAASHAKRPKSNGVAMFHNGTEEAMWLYIKQHAKEGNIDDILQCIDRFCYERHWMMHMGEKKRQVVLDVLQSSLTKHRTEQATSFTLVELGSYCGYSAIAMGKELDNNRKEHLFCIENHPNCVKWTKQLVEYAHLTDRVTVIHAAAHECTTWKDQLSHGMIDFLFIDHDKKAYYEDLVFIESVGLLRSGATVVADNVLCFNSPLTAYLDHVRNPNGTYSASQLYEGYLEYTTDEDRQDSATKDGIEVSVYRG